MFCFLYIYIIMYIHRQRHKDWTRLNYSCIVFEYGIQIVPFHKVLRQFGRFKNASGSWTSRSYWKSHLVSRIHAEICEFDANTHNKNWFWSYPLLSFQDVQLDWKSLWQRHAGSEFSERRVGSKIKDPPGSRFEADFVPGNTRQRHVDEKHCLNRAWPNSHLLL